MPIIVLAVVLVWIMSQMPGAAAAAPPPPHENAPASGTGLSIPSDPYQAAATILLHPDRVNKAIFGVSMDDFKSWDQLSAFDALKHSMSCCYHGNGDCCREAQLQAPGIRCSKGDCDEHPANLGNAIMRYRDSKGGPYTVKFGPKPLCKTQTAGHAPGSYTVDPYC